MWKTWRPNRDTTRRDSHSIIKPKIAQNVAPLFGKIQTPLHRFKQMYGLPAKMSGHGGLLFGWLVSFRNQSTPNCGATNVSNFAKDSVLSAEWGDSHDWCFASAVLYRSFATRHCPNTPASSQR